MTTIERDLDRDHADQLDEFELWLGKVDRILMATIGFRHTDLADRNWLDDFEAGESPRSAAGVALHDEFGEWT